MNDSRPTERFSYPALGSWSQEPWYPQDADPAYAQPGPYAPSYGGQAPPWAPSTNATNPTTQLPAHWRQDPPPSGGPPPGPPRPPGPKVPRWLWIGAGTALLLVVSLVIALILANDAIRTQTAVPPLPPMPESSPAVPPPSARLTPAPIPAPVPPTGGLQPPTRTTRPGPMQDIVYNVTGEGRALSIVYIATGDVIQTEFNVALPWTKEVSLAQSALHPANVTVVNFGNNVTCSLSVGGVQVSHRVGVGLTICDARG
ncbi:hypothetical protein MPRM_04150 [Mycobacterium parmense]|uniref:Uncharacterized protein n=2 Tax=Mycobacterium parmense TaxID=185642 RepID=A0A7I7YPQ1_9MYCO|nr:hypothetical protein AWC20_11470 [Mycobacterium parmense]BBZ43134.1 hypothetical protein MPRM_04150 [Mycobacterium parmense]